MGKGTQAASAGVDFLLAYGGYKRAARQSKLQSSQYALNASLLRNDADEAYRIGEVNSQITNIERAVEKGSTKAAFSGTGFVSVTGSSADLLGMIDTEYGKTIAAIRLNAAGEQNALMFESEKSGIQADYMKSLAKIQKRNAFWQGVVDAGVSFLGSKASSSTQDSVKDGGKIRTQTNRFQGITRTGRAPVR